MKHNYARWENLANSINSSLTILQGLSKGIEEFYDGIMPHGKYISNECQSSLGNETNTDLCYSLVNFLSFFLLFFSFLFHKWTKVNRRLTSLEQMVDADYTVVLTAASVQLRRVEDLLRFEPQKISALRTSFKRGGFCDIFDWLSCSNKRALSIFFLVPR